MRKLLLALAASAVLAAPAYAQSTAAPSSYTVPSPSGNVSVPTVHVCVNGVCVDYPLHAVTGVGADGQQHQLSTSNTGQLNITGQPALASDGGAFDHITNWPSAFGISGQLPGFAAAPTFNLGLLNGAAQDGTDATGVTPPTGGVGIRGWLSGIYKALTGTLTVGGSVAVTNLPATQAVTASSLPLPAGAAQDSTLSAAQAAPGSDAPKANTVQGCTACKPVATTSAAGLGSMAFVPAASTNGTALGSPPAGAIGARFYLGASDSVTFTVAGVAPSSAPAATFTISGASGGTGPNWDESLSGGEMIYVTATSGSPKFRWY